MLWIAVSGIRVLEIASDDAQITLVNPSPAVHLMAAVFGGDVQCRYDQVSSPAFEPTCHVSGCCRYTLVGRSLRERYLVLAPPWLVFAGFIALIGLAV